MSTAAWAKSVRAQDGERPLFLGLADHGVDVAAIAEGLAALPVVRRRLEALAGRKLTDVDLARIGVFAGLHDAGKANSGFQARLRGEKPDAGHVGPVWAFVCNESCPGLLSRFRKALRRRDWKGWFEDRADETAWWSAAFAHHGGLPDDDAPADPLLWADRGGYSPMAALEALGAALRRMFPDAFGADGAARLPSTPRLLHAVSGLVTLADWMGSDRGVFAFPSSGAPTGAARIPWARERAADVLRRRWVDPRRAREAAGAVRPDFASLYPDLPRPRPAQAALLDGPPPRPGRFVTLEAETGSGKTEAALAHFFCLFRAGEVDGFYFALPTRAAAAQIHRRTREAVRRWFGVAAPPVVLAVPGYLRVDGDEGQRLPERAGVLWPDDADTDRAWAAERPKRYLAGAAMVGTVDQLLMGGLRVRHAQLRSGPMLRLLLIVDEVHASDAYMTEILRNVLDQHAEAGGHALLMSATLGALARERLLAPGARVERRAAPALAEASKLPYPAIQRAGERIRSVRRDGGGEKRVVVELRGPAERDSLLLQAKRQAEAGAAVLFIRNTVRGACGAFRRLERIGAPLLRCEGVATPHHGRYAPEDRRRLDAALEEAFAGRRRAGVVAVTTQTAEQSLDICADRLICDIAPGDVLLQRIGRLHRHARIRPAGFETPIVDAIAPTAEELAEYVDANGEMRGRAPLGLGRVYRNVVGVLATREWLAERGGVHVPDDNRPLVEAATHDESLRRLADRLGPPWPRHLAAAAGADLGEAATARAGLLDWSGSLVENRPLDDRRIRTRLGLDDRRIDLPEPLPGPFGARVRTFALPGWMARALPVDAAPEDVSAAGGEIRFRLGGRAYRYDRLGLAQAGG